MARQAIASVASSYGAINGNKHNSSQNFKFLPGLSGDNGHVEVIVSDNNNKDSITFNLWIKKAAKDEKVLSELKNGDTFVVNTIEDGNEYYIGDPKSADMTTFVVTFMYFE